MLLTCVCYRGRGGNYSLFIMLRSYKCILRTLSSFDRELVSLAFEEKRPLWGRLACSCGGRTQGFCAERGRGERLPRRFHWYRCSQDGVFSSAPCVCWEGCPSHSKCTMCRASAKKNQQEVMASSPHHSFTQGIVPVIEVIDKTLSEVHCAVSVF